MTVILDRHHHLVQMVTAGHHFLLDVLPLREPESYAALGTFVAAAARIKPSLVDLDLVLLRCLEVLDAHTEQRIPSLLDQYVQSASEAPDNLTRFSQCVECLLQYQGIADTTVQEAMHAVAASFANPECAPRFIARHVDQRLETLEARFRSRVGCTLREYIRDVRLQHACTLLATSNKSIKEVWAEVGYGHHSNFDHDFKRQFHCTPSQYRQRVIRPAAQMVYRRRDDQPAPASTLSPPRSSRPTTLLIVDDDAHSRALLRHSLHGETTSVTGAASGSEGLRVAERLRPDVILAEYHLPDVDGLGFVQQLRSRPWGDESGIALFTADFRAFDRVDEARSLNATVASKLCALQEVRDLVGYLASQSEARATALSVHQQPPSRRNRWIV
jgi:AraC-like DNA-binding protein/CheY-like chemotaxis protein